MEIILLAIFLAFFLATIFNIIFKHYGISHIIGYIISGTLISYGFDFNGLDIHVLEFIGEFGIVFLMFTIGLEMNFDKIKKLKTLLFRDGVSQVVLSALIIFIIAYYLFSIEFNNAIIVSLAFSLSSTAIVLSYLKSSKDIYTPYGERSLAILLFQDLAVIPILLLMSFLSNDTLSISEVLLQTIFMAIILVIFMFTIGIKIVNILLDLSANSALEEIFLGAVLSIVLGSALLAHSIGFTYSLGAFISGVIIAETRYNVKVESDISSYKDLLLGTFFFSVGTKIDVLYFLTNLHYIVGIFLLVLILKIAIVFCIMRVNNDNNISIKTALAIGNIGEFSFAIFTLALSFNLLSSNLANFLILVSVISMILTPFIVNNIYKISNIIAKEYYESDVITPIQLKNHVIIAGFSLLGRVVANDLQDKEIPFVIISDNLKHVLHARKLGFMGYFGHLDKKAVLESLKVDEASSIIITVSKPERKKLISEAILNFSKDAHIIIKIDSAQERKIFRDCNISKFIDSNLESGKLIVNSCVKKRVD